MGIRDHCFVCKKSFEGETPAINPEVNLPVCENCKNTPEEKKAIAEYLDSLADDLFCGCI